MSGSVAGEWIGGGLVCGRETLILRKHDVERVGRYDRVTFVKYFTVGLPNFPL